MEKIDVDILEYLGKLENGVLVLVGLLYQKKYYESSFFYTEKEMVLTIPDDLEVLIGDIKQYPEYPDILLRILRKIVPYKDIYGTLDDVDFGKWIKGVIDLGVIGDEQIIDDSDIKPGPSTT